MGGAEGLGEFKAKQFFGGMNKKYSEEEVVESLSLEEVGVSGELVEGWELLDLSKRDGHASGFPVLEILLEEVDGGEGFIVLSAPGDEDEGGITSLILELSDESGDRLAVREPWRLLDGRLVQRLGHAPGTTRQNDGEVEG